MGGYVPFLVIVLVVAVVMAVAGAMRHRPKRTGKVFISYSSANVEYVKRLAGYLGEKGIDAWFDDQIDVGARWREVLRQRIGEASAVVVVMSPDAATSEWVGQEIRWAKEWHKKILPLLLAGDVLVSLADRQHEDVRGGKMPSREFLREAGAPEPAAAGYAEVESMFVDRDAQITMIRSLIGGQGGSRYAKVIVCIDGMPGVGKSALAKRIQDEFGPSYEVMEANLLGYAGDSGPASPEAVLATLLTADGLGAESMPTDLDGLTAQWRSRLANRRILLLLDDASSEQQVLPLLPGSTAFLVVITSHDRLEGLRSAHDPAAELIHLQVLSAEDGLTLLLRAAGRADEKDELAAAAAIVGLVESHPMAVRLVGAGMQGEPVTFRERLAELATADDILEGVDGPDGRIGRAFGVAYRRLPPGRQLLLRRLAAAPVADMDVFAAASMVDLPRAEVRDDLNALRHVGLLELRGSSFWAHDLLRVFLARFTPDDPEAERRGALDRLFRYYWHSVRAAEAPFARQALPLSAAVRDAVGAREFSSWHEAVVWARRERENLLRCAVFADNAGDAFWTIAFAEAAPAFLRNDGYWTQSEALQKNALRAGARTGNALAQANAQNELGFLRRLAGDIRGAEDRLAAGLGLYREASSRVGEAHALNNLGVVVDILGRSDDATFDLNSSLSIYREIGDRLGEANVLHDLGVAQRNLGELAAAASLTRQSLDLYSLVANPLGEAHASAYLAKIYRLTGPLDEAAGLLETARTLYADLGNRLGEANVTVELGAVWRLRGDSLRAISVLDQALDLQRELGNQRGEADSLSERGAAKRRIRDLAGAEVDLVDALALYESLGNRRGAVPTLVELGLLRFDLGDEGGAAELLQRAVTSARETRSRREEALATAGLARLTLHHGAREEGLDGLQAAEAMLRLIGAIEADEIAAEVRRVADGG